MDDMRRHWLSAIQDANPVASYKFATVYTISSIISTQTKNIEQTQPLIILQRDIAKEYLQLYWDTFLLHGIVHFKPARKSTKINSNERKQSKIMQLVENLWNEYRNYYKSNDKIRFEKFLRKIRSNDLLQKSLEKTLKGTYNNMKIMPLHFMKKEGILYNFDSSGNLIIPQDAVNCVIKTYPLIKYASLIELTKYLERINHPKDMHTGIMSVLCYISPHIKMRRPAIDRVCRELIENFHSSESERICPACHEIIESKSALDHTIPWVKIRSHDIWNLHPTHSSCNSSKNDNSPHDEQIRTVQSRNERMLEYFYSQNFEVEEQRKYVRILEDSIESNELWTKYVRLC